MANAIPIFEAKNKLPLFIHQAEENGPIFISRRGKSIAVLISLKDYNNMTEQAKKAQKKPNIVERIEAFHKRNGYIPDEEIDRIFGNVRDTTPDTYKNPFEEAFDD